jgi:hypothetical protein
MEEYAEAKCRLQDVMRTGAGSFWVHQTDPQRVMDHLLKTNYQTYGTDPAMSIAGPNEAAI